MVQPLLDACSIKKNDYQVAVLAFDSESEDCAKHVLVRVGPPLSGSVVER